MVVVVLLLLVLLLLVLLANHLVLFAILLPLAAFLVMLVTILDALLVVFDTLLVAIFLGSHHRVDVSNIDDVPHCRAKRTGGNLKFSTTRRNGNGNNTAERKRS